MLEYGAEKICGDLERVIAEVNKGKRAEYQAKAEGKNDKVYNINERKTEDIICF